MRMDTLRRCTMVTACLAFVFAAPALASTARTTRHPTGARVTMATARRTALGRVPGGMVKSSELEHEQGRLVYSFDIAVKGQPGVQEVLVDAMTDSVLSGTHQSAKAERAEAKRERMKHGTPAKDRDSLRTSSH